jgi:predicted membrane channel-forming protein YqfA (hemolysin III family)
MFKKMRTNALPMKSTDRDSARREPHWRFLKWCLFVVLVVAGLWLILTSVTEISHVYFCLGLLLFMLGSFWYGYDKGYNVGKARGYERGIAAQRESAQSSEK